jgi:hypothetical protein
MVFFDSIRPDCFFKVGLELLKGKRIVKQEEEKEDQKSVENVLNRAYSSRNKQILELRIRLRYCHHHPLSLEHAR